MTLTVVITGGLTEYPPRYPYPATATVSVYGLQGWMEDLQPLNIGRFLHACSSYVSGGTRVRLDLESTGSSHGVMELNENLFGLENLTLDQRSAI